VAKKKNQTEKFEIKNERRATAGWMGTGNQNA
jgi:hypothetical protein